MEKAPNPSSQADSPTLVPESGAPLHRPDAGPQTLTPPPSSDSPTLVPESSSADTPTLAPESSSAAGQTGAGVSTAGEAWGAGGPQPGAVLGNRYEILQALGEGGMGTVYKARDRELDRLVALKVIRPDLARNPAIIQRFKQELILARQVTHRNVVRIFDLGEADGIKFITMEFIEGKDLRSLLLEHTKFSPEEAAEIIRQVCLALDTAHSEGVIHRDLKPQNIMRDASGRIVVMDFGLARSLESDGMTQTGALIGTMEYMSPEQGLGQELDQRSDLFTLGLIFYELLSGQVPYKADSALASLLKRTQERAAPVSSLDNKVPGVLSNIVSKCLERDPKLRYSSAKELLSDLDAWQGKSAAASIRLPAVQPWGQDIPWVGISVAAVVLILAVTAFLLRGKLFGPSAKGPAGPVASLAILPFRNGTSDSSIDWYGPTLADMLRTDMGQSGYLRTVPSDRIDQILHDLRLGPEASFDPDTLRRVAEFTSADRLISGRYVKLGGQIRISATLQDLKHQTAFPLQADAASEKDLPKAMEQLAQAVQKKLALSTDTIKEIQATSLHPSTQSVQALGDYGQGMQLSRQGKYLQAVKQFEAATTQDPKFALAFAELGKSYAALGYGDKAQDASRKALDLSDSVTPQEKLLIQAENAQATKDYGKAIESYEKLAKILPDDPDIQYTLARLYEDFGTLDKAGAYYQKLLASDKNNPDALLHMGWVEIRGNNPEGSIGHLNSALTLAVQLDNQEERASILDAFGNAYQYMNKREDALNSFQQALDIKRRLGDKGGVAETLNWMAGVQQDMGKADAALKSYEEAVSLRREIGDKMGLGRSLTDLGLFKESLGKYDEALALSKEGLALLHEAGDRQNEANCLNNIGWTYLDEADYANAMTYFQQALGLRQKIGSPAFIADSFYNIGDTYTRMGQYDQATDDFLKALDLWRKAGDKRGVAFASYGLGKVFQYQGRYGAALNAQQDALKSWREVNESGMWLPQIQASYGNTLTLLGRGTDAQKNLDEALRTAREVKNDPLIAQILNFEGDRVFYSGDFAGARSWFEQASKITSRNPDREQTLITKFNLAKVAVMQGRTREEFSTLQSLADDADRAGLEHLSMECSVYLGQALITAKEYSRAQEVLQRSLANSEKLGLQVSLAKSHFLLGEALRLGGSAAEAPHHYAEARRILDGVAKESHSDTLLKRSDLAKMYQQSAQLDRPTS
ncbi:MAG TPA: tetratricopeptide repeat protein [Terriglobales bacterium]|jgi:tetratricopeptide (TPR) repeat protein/predicted Ser/Thr protein kinase|nr:tetratricopeptide repeat protein [Terriglobales bacterium]